MKHTITHVRGRQIWDSRGRPTVEADVTLAGGARGRAMAPAGASRGAHEALDLRDGGERFGGFGVDRAVAAVNGEIARTLTGRDVRDQAGLDSALETLDGTPGFARLGANAAVAVSLAALHAAAAAEGLPLWRYLAGDARVRIPLPEVQIFGGGAHAGRRTDVQDFMVMCPRAATVRQAFEITADVYRAAGALMEESGRLAGVADEGGWWPLFASNEEALETLARAIDRSGWRAGHDVFISLDVAANELGHGDGYRLPLDGAELSTTQMVDRVAGWAARYPILSIEDPVSQDDVAGMADATARFGQRVQVIGDDFLVTNAERVRKAAAAGACNAVLVKVNQAGTVSRAKAALEAARALGWSAIVSARSGETEDVSIAHLSTGWDAGQLKVGSFTRSERMAKWNELLRIEEEMGADAVFAGAGALPASVAETLA
ncbi:phosphopyruvate hydratase [Phenylobacterium sp. SCN 70-31]|uniref:phosphopyruvate hydratase n=1 Tax=Phenylobacterium sp. SCN 70-31 TaxID=1660129 RepID=UPI00086B7BB2|nr:phosphopyruvate hydratase [Phenylobacterium sp. SCN 70-31]ODT86738.1 MAG: phosphopyruvate hydratase [Phenylobacterium sp. SCN 70-31]